MNEECFDCFNEALAYLGDKLPLTANVFYAEQHCDWSWGETLIVWEYGGKFFSSDGYVITEVTQEEALEEMIEFEEMFE